ncbi:MAG: hypothetical protein ACYT04_29230 [Nostoc sp.]
MRSPFSRLAKKLTDSDVRRILAIYWDSRFRESGSLVVHFTSVCSAIAVRGGFWLSLGMDA